MSGRPEAGRSPGMVVCGSGAATPWFGTDIRISGGIQGYSGFHSWKTSLKLRAAAPRRNSNENAASAGDCDQLFPRSVPVRMPGCERSRIGPLVRYHHCGCCVLEVGHTLVRSHCRGRGLSEAMQPRERDSRQDHKCRSSADAHRRADRFGGSAAAEPSVPSSRHVIAEAH